MLAPSDVQLPLYSSSDSSSDSSGSTSSSGSSSLSDSGDSSISSASMHEADSLSSLQVSLQEGDDDSTISSVETDSSSEDTMDRFMLNYITVHHAASDESDASLYEGHDGHGGENGRRPRRAKRWAYELGEYFESNYFHKFLREDIRANTYIKSRDRKSVFRSRFRVPLVTIDHLTDMFMARGWVQCTKRCNTRYKLHIRTQLFIMCALEHLGNKKPHIQFTTDTNMSQFAHSTFFDMFIDRLYENKDDYIKLPPNLEALMSVQSQYADVHLPGACGSIDVVHVKWSCCPAGDFNKCKGKESFASVAFECVTDNRRRILGIAPIQFGSRSDKHIVRLDPTVTSIKMDWYKDVEWECYNINGEVKRCRGMYLICDGGYLRWETLICPYAGTNDGTGRRGYFNTNLESVRKDVECTYGILKKRWRILDYGIHYYDMKKCEKVFTVCSVLHNMLLDLPEDEGFRRVTQPVGRGASIGRYGLWLEGPQQLQERFATTSLRAIAREDRAQAQLWLDRRDLLAEHIEFCKSLANE